MFDILKWVAISFAAAILIYALNEIKAFWIRYGTISRIETTLDGISGIASNICQFEDSFFLGALAVKMSFSNQRQPKESELVLVSETKDGVNVFQEEKHDVNSEGLSGKSIFDEQIVRTIPRWPNSEFRMPRYVKLAVLGEEKIYELVPIVVDTSGYWKFWGAEDESEVQEDNPSGKKNWRRSRRPFRFWDYLTTGDIVGTVLERRFSRIKSGKIYSSPENGHIIGFQVLNGTKVDSGDVVMILVAPRDLPIRPIASSE